MLLGEEGDGWRQVTAELAFERSGPERFLSTFPLLLELVRQGEASRSEMADIAVGTIVSRMWSIRQLSRGVAAMMDDGVAPAVEAALVKDIGTQLEQEIVNLVRRAAPQLDDYLAAELSHASAHAPGFTLRG